MQEQSFTAPMARRTDPKTSHDAAADATVTASAGRMAVLRALHNNGPLTDFELADRAGWQQTSIGKRRLECVDAGLVDKHTMVMSGEVIRRRTPSGSTAIVWTITEWGRKFFLAASKK